MRDQLHVRLTASCSLLVLTILGFAACSKPAKQIAHVEASYWTCAMHPSVLSDKPGKCPICGMDLVPVNERKSDIADGTAPGEFTVPIQRQQQIGVTYAEARRRPMRFEIRSVGTLEVDQGQVFECVTGVDGYIEELKVTSPGERITVGQPLMAIHTPDLYSPEQELANMLKVQQNGSVPAASLDQVVDLARRRLRLLNVSPIEISELERTRQPTDHLLLRSPFDGVVSDAPMKVGMSVKRGDKVMTVLNLSRLWLWANFYENEIGLLKEGQPVTVTLSAFPNESVEGKISVISPMIDPVTRKAKVRIDVPNPDGQLRPGMYANAVAKIDAGEGLTIPVDAVLPTGSRMLVFVDKGFGRLKPRFIQLGRQYLDPTDPTRERYYQVTGGLQEGERVVSSANFLIDAEAQVQGALRDFGEEANALRGK
jgi:Cu(I)/Ag(I) efflux system membrane fusion protein